MKNGGAAALNSRDAKVKYTCRAAIAYKDELKRRAAFHSDRFARMVREHKYGNVVGWVLAPPPFPVIVEPWSSDRSKHVPTDDPRSDVSEPARRKVIVQAGRTSIIPMHPPERARRKHPLEQGRSSDAKRIGKVLIGTRAKPVDGHADAQHAKFGHGLCPFPGINVPPMRADYRLNAGSFLPSVARIASIKRCDLATRSASCILPPL